MKLSLLILCVVIVPGFLGCSLRKEPPNEVATDRATKPNLEWAKTFGGPEDDEVKYLVPAADGGYVVCGWTASQGAGKRDAWVFCVDDAGAMRWQKTFGGPEDDESNFIERTKAGGYVVCGLTSSQGKGEADAWVFSIDAKGELLWEKTYGGERFDRAEAIAQAADGGFLVTAGTRSQGAGLLDAWVIRIDDAGELISERTLGGEKFDRLSFVRSTRDGGFIACGQTGSQGAGGIDLWVVRFDESGKSIWEKTFGSDLDNWGECIIETADGGFIAAGESKPPGSHKWDAWIVRLDRDGTMLWDNSFGGNGDEWFNSAVETSEGEFIFCGVTESVGAGDRDVWIVKTDRSGKLQWQQPFGGSQLDNGYGLREIAAGQYIACARTSSTGQGKQDAWILRFSEPQ